MIKKLNTSNVGCIGEEIAIEFVVKNDYKLITRNYRVGRIGEIDIIAWNEEYLCFIEVKSRRNMLFGAPCEAVNYKKQQKIITLANIFISEKKLFEANIRFDVIEIILKTKEDTLCAKTINLIKNAF